MTVLTTDTALIHDLKLLDDARGALQTMRAEIQRFCERLTCDEDTANAPDVRRLYTLFNTCTETEGRLAKARNEKAGIAQNGIAFDLDEARAEIGRKLDRLRDA